MQCLETIPKCEQAIYYFLTAAEKQLLLLFYRATGSVFPILSPVGQVIKLVSPNTIASYVSHLLKLIFRKINKLRGEGDLSI